MSVATPTAPPKRRTFYDDLIGGQGPAPAPVAAAQDTFYDKLIQQTAPAAPVPSPALPVSPNAPMHQYGLPEPFTATGPVTMLPAPTSVPGFKDATDRAAWAKATGEGGDKAPTQDMDAILGTPIEQAMAERRADEERMQGRIQMLLASGSMPTDEEINRAISGDTEAPVITIMLQGED